MDATERQLSMSFQTGRDMCHQRGSWDMVITAIVMEGPVFISRREETSWVSECLSAFVLDLREQSGLKACSQNTHWL